MRKHLVLSPLYLSLALSGVSHTALAERKVPEDLFQDVWDGIADIFPSPQAKNGRQRLVRLNFDRLKADAINLNIFDDTLLVAEKDRVVDNVHGHSAWIGHLQGEPDSEVILAVIGNTMAGTVKRGTGEVYEILSNGDDTHTIREVDTTKILPHKDPIPDVEMDPDLANAPAASDAEASANEPPMAAASTGDTIVDLMVVYTPKARANAGGTSGIQAKIVKAVEAANQAYINSKVHLKLNLVRMAEVSYKESGDMARTLNDLRGTSDGKMDIVHSWRNQYGADQVALVSADANYCGIAYQMTRLSSSFAPYAFAVVHDDSKAYCLAAQTLAHELGHNQGNAHDRANSSSPGIYSYSYGHRLCQSGGFRTIMSYACSGATRISNFANPNVYYNGKATGIDPNINPSKAAATAWSIEKARSVVAAWRASKVTASAPAAPSGLRTAARSDDEIVLRWKDNSDNEEGFKVERSDDGVNWDEVALLGHNTTRFANTGLSPSTRYSYRVSAYNGAAQSAPSEIVTTATTSTMTGSARTTGKPTDEASWLNSFGFRRFIRH
ncbi:M12 family metallo-peptidase [Methylocaldum szegediense]|uniref:Peptidyl-Asp metalloendopeptidase n=1 Tax=Methylocaldum szegediense TaxID=73780 RepID=A0ABM9I1P1_9GAMM|nr:M12 family metallo-peptidase [Methylocaldum szegediense]CAI8831601.1 peptidyl-Asp metalloendopeptidase [Methylocaldum szegediense]